MTIDPKHSTSWRDRLQVFAQMAAIGSFMAALIIASLAIANYWRLPAEALPPCHGTGETDQHAVDSERRSYCRGI